MAVRRTQKARTARRRAPAGRVHPGEPHLCLVRAPEKPVTPPAMRSAFSIATYNVHRWTGRNGRVPDPARAGFVISELDVDVIALQEVLRPSTGDDPILALSEALGLHLAFAATRTHRQGELGNAILSRWPIASVSMLDLSFSRLERRVAVAARFGSEAEGFGVVATHLALGDRTRHRQVRSLLEHPQLQSGPVVLLGDMNAWRQCKATRALDDELESHHNLNWPASFPSARPVLALDRIYARRARIVEIDSHVSRAARAASDHLPIIARVEIENREKADGPAGSESSTPRLTGTAARVLARARKRRDARRATRR